MDTTETMSPGLVAMAYRLIDRMPPGPERVWLDVHIELYRLACSEPRRYCAARARAALIDAMVDVDTRRSIKTVDDLD